MLDRIPFGGARRIMGDGDYQVEAVGDFMLQEVFPGADADFHLQNSSADKKETERAQNDDILVLYN